MKHVDRLFDYNNFFGEGQMKIPAGDIIQVAELSLIRNGEIPHHIQLCDEITYAVSGKATIYSGDSQFKMSAGQIHYIRQGQAHRIVADPDHHFHYCCIGFILDPCCKSTQNFLHAIQDIPDFLAKDEGNIHTLFDLLMNEFFIRDDESDAMINFYLCQMLILLYRILNGASKEKSSKTTAPLSNQAVYRALKYIDRHYLRLTSVKNVAKELSYSEYYLSHEFKQKMDITMKDYLLRKKIMTAAELLKYSNMSISEITEQLNFSSLNTFGAAFKRYMHVSASEFRRQNSK